MRKLTGFLVLALMMLVSFRIDLFEPGNYDNTVQVILFLVILYGFFMALVLIQNKTHDYENH